MDNPITSTEAARRLHVSIATVTRLIQRGELVAEKKTITLAGNSGYLISAASVDAYRLKRQGQTQTQPN